MKTNKNLTRMEYGLLAGVVGIILNLFLFLFKLGIGFFSLSISIIADSINNLSDGASAIVAIIGFKIADKPADNEHPFGYARGEYISGFIISILIVVIGIQLLINSIKSIIEPTELIVNIYVIIILICSILVKLWLYKFNMNIGKKINSHTLIATAVDSLNDVYVTLGVLCSIILSYYINFNLDAYIGCVIAIFIIYSGFKLIKETVSPLLGEAPNPELIQNIKSNVMSYDGVIGFHDLIVHTYGHAQVFCSLHVELDAKVDIMLSHELIDTIERELSQKLGINMLIHLDPVITDNKCIMEMKEMLEEIVYKIDTKLEVHDFRIIKEAPYTNLIFDLAVPDDFVMSDEDLVKEINTKVKGYSDFLRCIVKVDKNYISTYI
ncbi:MAG: hypothetical protein BEN19_01170 [Epulopiscium sp. Nuni2H_MBin003]|nr:MAG: hypothetical protein BEN19_01170 [Epulopiscium sp. Nuni2H_MBin003]